MQAWEGYEPLSSEAFEEDKQKESRIRPHNLATYIGQSAMKEELSVYIQASLERDEALDHVLLYGPPGLGKTTLAHVLAAEMQVKIITTSGPAIEKTGDILVLLNELQAGDVLFIDEIHRLPRVVEEMLYSAMEDFRVDILLGQQEDARPISLDLPPFTLIGATTRAGVLSAPLRDRFGIVKGLRYYTSEELAQIIERTAGVLGSQIEAFACQELASRSRGTPRIANRLFRRVRDFSQVYQANAPIDVAICRKALDILGVDALGLDRLDRQILETMIHFYGGGPVGLSTLAANLSEDKITLEDMVEPYLIQQGLLLRTPRGRMVTDLAYRHLGIEPVGEDKLRPGD